MAIAFYVPPEYGPAAQPANNNEGQPAPADNIQHQQDANNNLVQGGANNQQGDNNLPLFLHLITQLRFFQEIIRAWNANTGDDANQQEQEVEQNHEQDNQNGENNLEAGAGAASPPLMDLLQFPFRSLPDLVTCHAGMTFRLGSHHENQNDEEESQPPPVAAAADQIRGGEPVAPLSPRSSQAYQSPRMDIEFNFNVKVGCSREPAVENLEAESVVPGPLSPEEEFRRTGAQLRRIADNLQMSRANNRRTSGSTLELNVVIRLAVPAATIIGIGLWYLRRS